MRTLLACVLISFAFSALGATERSALDLDTRRVALRKLLARQWEHTLRSNPEFASILGDKRWNDKVTDVSPAGIAAQHAANLRFLKRFKAVDVYGFSEKERLDRDLMIEELQNEIELHPFRSWETPVNQMGGIHLDAPQIVSLLSFETVKDYEDYLNRLALLPATFQHTMAHMRAGQKRGNIPPKFLLEKVTTQADQIAATPPAESPFAMPLSKFPASIEEADRARIRTQFLSMISEKVVPAYKTFASFVREQYAPAGRSEVGVWSLPDGERYYAYRVKRSTTTDMSPDQIHQIGLSEVARIETEMLEIARKLGHADLKAFNAAIEANPKLKATSREQILDEYRKYNDQMYAKLPTLFGRLPKAKLEVMAVQEFREKGAAGAYYEQGTPDGSRPGHVMVNTGDFASRKLITNESTAYHEGVPGHHMQIAIAQELDDLPPFRQQANHTAYVEGWALYSERLGKEVGFYQDPYSDYGRLQDEMLRAIRLVVDTGLHSKRWTREQVVQFFRDHSALDDIDIQSETDRYIVWPGQALGYKIGQMKILELREKARRELGAKFDIRAFHDEVLGAGSLPMSVLEARINRWISRF